MFLGSLPYCENHTKWLLLEHHLFNTGANIGNILRISKFYAKYFTVCEYFMGETLKDRLQYYIEHIGSNPRKFSISIGRSDSYVRTMGKSIGSDAIGEILRYYPSLNVNWLITGVGDMEVPSDVTENRLAEMSRTIASQQETIHNLSEVLKKEVDSLRASVKNADIVKME